MTADLDTLDKLAAEALAARCYCNGSCLDEPYGAFHRAADPTTIRALIARVRELEAALTVERIAEALVTTTRAVAKEDWPFLKGDGWPAYSESSGHGTIMVFLVSRLAAALRAELLKP